MKSAFIFGGQGTQYTGMGQKVYNRFKKARNVFELASSITGYDVARICFEALQDELNRTIYSQICTLVVELAIYEVFKDQEIQPTAMAGFSLGEYAALVASNVISMKDAFKLVNARSQIMECTVKDGTGRMVAVINLNVEQIETVCDEIGKNKAMISNYNSYKQFVVSLATDVWDSFTAKIKAFGGYIIPLKVNRPFHHSMMREAANKYYAELVKYEFTTPDCPIYINVSGERFNMNDSFHEKLYKQIFMPVQWIKTIENMLLDGIDTFYEITPKSILAPFVINISNGDAKIIDVQNKITKQF